MRRERQAGVDQIARWGQELKARTFLQNARKRSERRRSAWNLSLPLFALPLWCFCTSLLAWVAVTLHAALHPHQASLLLAGRMDLNAAFIFFSSMIATVCPSLTLANLLAHSIPPARRAMEAESRTTPGTGYQESQRALIKSSSWIFIVCVPFLLAGALLA